MYVALRRRPPGAREGLFEKVLRSEAATGGCVRAPPGRRPPASGAPRQLRGGGGTPQVVFAWASLRARAEFMHARTDLRTHSS